MIKNTKKARIPVLVKLSFKQDRHRNVFLDRLAHIAVQDGFEPPSVARQEGFVQSFLLEPLVVIVGRTESPRRIRRGSGDGGPFRGN